MKKEAKKAAPEPQEREISDLDGWLQAAQGLGEPAAKGDDGLLALTAPHKDKGADAPAPATEAPLLPEILHAPEEPAPVLPAPAAAADELDGDLVLPMQEGLAARLGRVLSHARGSFRGRRLGQGAAALSFSSALLLGPLAALAVGVLRVTGHLDPYAPIPRALAYRLLPLSTEVRPEAALQLAALAERGSPLVVIGAAALALVVLGYLLFRQAERLLGDLWSGGAGKRPAEQAPAGRPLLHRVLLFNGALTLLPPLALLWGAATAAQASGGGAPYAAAGLAVSLLTLSLIARVLPPAPVPLAGALLAGTVAALLVEGAKLAAVPAVRALLLQRPGIYGALLLVPLALLGLYLCWLAVLLGAALAQAVEATAPGAAPADGAPGPAEGEDGEGEAPPEREVLLDEEIVLGIMADIAAHFAGGHKALPARTLWERRLLPERLVRRVLQRLEQRDLVLALHDGYLPARPLDRIGLLEILHAFRVPGGPLPSPALGKVLREIDERGRSRLAQLTLADIT